MKDFTFANEQTKSDLAETWLEKAGRTREDFEEFLPFVNSEQTKSRLAETWLANPERIRDDFVAVFSLFDDEQTKSRLAETWLANPERIRDDFVAVLPLFDYRHIKSRLAETWLEKAGRTREDFEEFLPFVNSKQTKSRLAETWLANPERIRDDFVAVLPLFDDEQTKSRLAGTWLANPERIRDDFVAVLPLFDDRHIKSDLAEIWLANPKRTKEDFVASFSLFDDEQTKSYLARTWLVNPKRTNEDFVAVFSLFDDERIKFNLVITWLRKSKIDKEDFVAVLSVFADRYIKSYLARTWLANPKRTKEDFVAVFSLFDDKQTKSDLAGIWLKKPERTGEDFVAFLPFVADPYTKSTLLRTWLNRQQNPDIAYGAFVEFAKADLFISLYSTQSISSSYSQLSLQPALSALTSKIPDLCKDLYPENELYQAMLFKDCVNREDQNILTANKPALKSFIQGLNDEFALESLKALSAKINIPPLEVLEISKNRFNVKYESIRDALINTGREAAFDEIKAGQSLLTKFGEGNIEAVSEASLSDIFAYYDFKGLMGEFMSILQPEFKTEITNKFSPSDKSPYISREEFAKLKILFPKIELPEVGILGSFLKTKIGNRIPSKPLTKEEIAAFQFGKSYVLETLPSEVEQESKEGYPATNSTLENLTVKFRELLSATDPEVKDVADFFAEAINIKDEFGYTNQDSGEKRGKQTKLTNFFKGNKTLAAHLLAKDNGLDEIKGLILDIGAGCAANIATQFKSTVYRVALGENFNLAALYGVFRDKISVPILNSGGDHLGGSSEGTDIFTLQLIAQSRISPNGLLKALVEEFLVDGKQTANSSETILRALGEENRSEIAENIRSVFPEEKDFNQKFAEIAAYCALKPINGLLENRHFSNFPNGLFKALVKEFLADEKEIKNSAEAVPQALGEENHSEIAKRILSEFPKSSEAILEALDEKNRSEIVKRILSEFPEKKDYTKNLPKSLLIAP